MNVGEIVYALRGNLAPLQADLGKAEASAKTTGGRIASSLSVGKVVAGVGAVASVGLAVATKGLLELDSAAQNFRATVGATEAETKSAQGAIAEAFKTHRQSYAELGEGLAALRTDMGLTQEQAEEMLGPMADFATVSGQTVPAAVAGLDNILDAFNLTAEDTAGVMDKVVYASQHGAGSISDVQAALAGMGPQLSAANMTLDDGVALLTAMGDAGVDAGTGQKALQAALAQVKSPAELQRLMDDIAGTEDAFERGTKATELFGTRAGVKMAAVLKPGGKSLADYKTAIEDADGATQAAADAMAGSVQAQFAQGIKNITGSLVELAAPAGPILAAVGALVTGGGSFLGALGKVGLGLDVMATKAKAAWASALGPLSLAIAAGLITYDQFNQAIQRGAQEMVVATQAVEDRAAAEGRAVTETERWYAANGQVIAQEQAHIPVAQIMAESYGDLWGSQVKVADGTRALSDELGLLDGRTGTASQAVQDAAVDMGLAWDQAKATFANTDQFNAAVTDLGLIPGAVTETWTKPLADAARKGRESVTTSISDIASALAGARSVIADALKESITGMYDPLILEGRIAKVQAELNSADLAKALKSKDPDIRADAELRQLELRKDLAMMMADRTKYGNDASRAAKIAGRLIDTSLVEGLKSTDELKRTQAQAATKILTDEYIKLKGNSLDYGRSTGNAYADGLIASAGEIRQAAIAAVSAARGIMIAHSPPGPASPLHEIDKWGKATGLAWVDAFVEALGTTEELAKLKLAGVQGAFDEFVRKYKGVGGLLGGFTPEADRANLERYLGTLRATLANSSDPEERLEIYRKMADYQARLVALQDDVATADEIAAQKLAGYITNLDKALLTETDPARVKAITDQIITYVARLQEILNPDLSKVAAPPAPPAQTNTAASGGVYVEQSPGVWAWVPNAPAAAAEPPPAAASQATAGGLTTVTGAPPNYYLDNGLPNPSNPPPGISLVVNNPAPEPASVSLTQRLQLAASGLAAT